MSKRTVAGVAAIIMIAASCGGSESADTNPTASVEANTGLRLISADEGAALQSAPPADLVILDVRTPEEFAEGHLDGAVMIDFYDADFAEQLAGLDPDVPYLLYCRSGNRSGQTIEVMRELGFTDVADIDGGILSWSDAGLPTVAP